MTREEAIKHITTWMYATTDLPPVQVAKAFDMALSALRPVSREHAEKAWRGEWIYDPDTSYMYCEICKHTICQTDYLNGNPPPFCEMCGAPMTGEAVQMVMERVEALYD